MSGPNTIKGFETEAAFKYEEKLRADLRTVTAERDALRQEVVGVTNSLGIQLEVSRRNRDRILALEAALLDAREHISAYHDDPDEDRRMLDAIDTALTPATKE